MKKIITISFLLASFSGFCDKYVWNQKTGYPGVGRHRASGISIGQKAYYGLGHVSSGTAADIGFQDWWEFDPATNSWTQKADYPHWSHGATGFTIGNKGYMGSGTSEDASVLPCNDFYEFDPVANTWTAIANCPLNGDGHVSFTINGIGYLGLGYSGASLYAYNPITNMWVTKTSAMPGGWYGSAFVINDKAYYIPSYSNTLYEYNPATNSVITKAPFIGIARIAGAAFSVRGQGYFGLGTLAFDSPDDLKDFYFYDPITNVWDTILKSFPGVRRHFVPCVTIGDNAYFGTGTNGTNLADFWCYEWKIAVGVSEQQASKKSITVFPNPCNEILNVELEVLNTQSKFIITDLLGKSVFQKTELQKQNSLNIAHLAEGAYFVSVFENNQLVYTQKIIKTN